MTVLVTGGAGYIGSHMVLALLDAGEQVLVVDNLSTGFKSAVSPKAHFLEGDAGDVALISQAARDFNVNAIFHFAGSVVVPESVSDPIKYYENNTVRSLNIIKAAIASGIKHFIFSSTAAVYGDSGNFAPLVETDQLRPSSPYASSKLMTEAMLEDTSRAHDFRYTILRYFNVAGADPLGRAGQSTAGATHLIKVAVEATVGKRNHIDIFGTDYPTTDGTCIRDFIHVSDLVEAHLLALRRLRAGGKSLIANCGYGRGYSVLQVVNELRSRNLSRFEVRLLGRRPGDLISVVANPSLAKSELNWQPRFDNLQTIIDTAIAWEDKSHAP